MNRMIFLFSKYVFHLFTKHVNSMVYPTHRHRFMVGIISEIIAAGFNHGDRINYLAIHFRVSLFLKRQCNLQIADTVFL